MVWKGEENCLSLNTTAYFSSSFFLCLRQRPIDKKNEKEMSGIPFKAPFRLHHNNKKTSEVAVITLHKSKSKSAVKSYWTFFYDFDEAFSCMFFFFDCEKCKRRQLPTVLFSRSASIRPSDLTLIFRVHNKVLLFHCRLIWVMRKFWFFSAATAGSQRWRPLMELIANIHGSWEISWFWMDFIWKWSRQG